MSCSDLKKNTVVQTNIPTHRWGGQKRKKKKNLLDFSWLDSQVMSHSQRYQEAAAIRSVNPDNRHKTSFFFLTNWAAGSLWLMLTVSSEHNDCFDVLAAERAKNTTCDSFDLKIWVIQWLLTTERQLVFKIESVCQSFDFFYVYIDKCRSKF